MVVLDANVILRYLLNDNEAMAREAESIIKQKLQWFQLRLLRKLYMY